MERKVGVWCVVLAAVAWGLLGIFVRELNKVGLESIQIVAVRAIGATWILLFFLLIRDRAAFRIKGKDIWIFLGTGIGSMVFFNFCYFASIKRTSLAVAAALLYTAPAFVALLARLFLKEKITKNGIVAIAFAMIGCMLTAGLFRLQGGIDVTGLLFGLGSGIGYALYSIFGKFAIQRGYKSTTITFYTFLVAMLCTWPSLLELGGKDASNQISGLEFVEGRFLFSLLGLILISTIAAYMLYTMGLSRVKANTASVLASIEPLVATGFSLLVFKEAITWDVLLGIVCILISTIIISMGNSKHIF